MESQHHFTEIESNLQNKYNENNTVLLNAVASWLLWTWGLVFLYLKSSAKEGLPDVSVVKNLPANAGDTGSTPDLGRLHMPQSS